MSLTDRLANIPIPVELFQAAVEMLGDLPEEDRKSFEGRTLAVIRLLDEHGVTEFEQRTAFLTGIQFRLEALSWLHTEPAYRAWSMKSGTPGMDYIHSDLVEATGQDCETREGGRERLPDSEGPWHRPPHGGQVCGLAVEYASLVVGRALRPVGRCLPACYESKCGFAGAIASLIRRLIHSASSASSNNIAAFRNRASCSDADLLASSACSMQSCARFRKSAASYIAAPSTKRRTVNAVSFAPVPARRSSRPCVRENAFGASYDRAWNFLLCQILYGYRAPAGRGPCTWRQRKLSMEKISRDTRFQITISAEELAAVDDFRFKTRMPTRAAAVRELLRRGLEGYTAASDTETSEFDGT
jgi:hypothetical protein